VNLCRFEVAEFLGDIACDSPIGVLVDGCGDKCWDVFACEFFMNEAWRGLDGGPIDPADVGAVLETKAAPCGAVGDSFGDF